MDKKNKIIKAVEDRIGKSKSLDIIINIIKTILNSTKVGSPIVSLFSYFIPSRRLIRLEKFAAQLAEDMKKNDDKIDTDFITTDEFAFIFEQCFKAASENYQKEKLDAFRAIIINSLTDNTTNQDEKDFFLNLTNTLTVLHIKILKFLYNPKEYLKYNNLDEGLVYGHGFKKIFMNVFNAVDIETIMIAFEDLSNYGFLNTNKGIFNAQLSNSGFHLIGTGDRITKIGGKYIEFISNI